MLYSKNVNELGLLQLELEKLKTLYERTYREKGVTSSVKDLRKMIKALSARINMMKSTYYENVLS